MLRHNPWTRLLWSAAENGATLFAAGSAFACERAAAETVCDTTRLERDGPALAGRHAGLLCQLVNAGHLYLEAPK